MDCAKEENIINRINHSKMKATSKEIPFDFVKQGSFGMEAGFQINQQHIPENKATREGVEFRVFTDVQSDKKEIPRKLLAFER